MALTYDPIATTTLGSAQSSVTFSSISGSYTDLILIVNSNNAGAAENYAYMYFNSDTTNSNYSRTVINGDGTSATSSRFSNQIPITNQPTDKSNQIIHIMNYSNATTFKTSLWRSNSPNQIVSAGVGLWRNTAAITTITLTGFSANFASGSVFTLYGIKAA